MLNEWKEQKVVSTSYGKIEILNRKYLEELFPRRVKNV